MNSVVQYNLHDTNSSCCCCCCCCYCCFQSNESPQQISSSALFKTSDSCSCCSCLEDTIDPDEEKFNQKKTHAIEELLQTERDYVDDLNHLSKVCLQVLDRQPWIIPDHIMTIKRNMDDILSFHLYFITSLNTVQYNGSMIAKTFLDQVSNFSLYKQYCKMHSEAWSLVSVYRNRSEWADFIKECSTQKVRENDSLLHQQHRLHFEDYLIKPVQRICRYQLLVKEIIKYTSTQTPEYDLWTAVLSEMQEIVSEIDNSKFQRDMEEKTNRFIERLEDDWRITKENVSQLGHLLVAGAIEVTYSALGSSVSKPKYLGCLLFSTYMIMVRPKKLTSYEPKHWFPLKIAEFEDLEDIEGQREHSFIISCKKHTFVFSATCTQEKQMWIKRIQEAIIESKTKNLNETIISSLTGVTPKNFPMRPSRSFSNILELTLTHSDKKLSRQHSLRRSMSTFEETSRSVHDRGNLVKRYSADYATRKKTEINPRNHHSETYVKPDFSTPKRRPSSLDLLSDTGVIGKMSIQFKNNHQNAMRHNVDHKLRDVCSQEYLSSRAWYMRDTFEISHPVEKKKSVLRNSVSNLSLMMPKRSETKTLLVSPEAENDSRPSSTLPRNHSRASRASVPQPESFDCTFHLVASTDSNCSLKGKKKTLKQRVLRQIAGIRHIRSSIPEWRMSADTLKCDNVKTSKKHSSLKNLSNPKENENGTFSAFSFATTPSKKKSWKSRLPKLFFMQNSSKNVS